MMFLTTFLRKVIRRVGGLEDHIRFITDGIFVIRRVGGLEVPMLPKGSAQYVIRRVGGLEVPGSALRFSPGVIRRVGGLEEKGGSGVSSGVSYPPCRRLRRSMPPAIEPTAPLSAV